MASPVKNTDFTPPADPLALFAEWFDLAVKHEPDEPNAMAVATVDETGAPSLRHVLLKYYDQSGFCFYTNQTSRKGKQLEKNNKATMCFYWKSLDRQVRIEGVVEKVSQKESEDYFASRDRGSQIGAWASLQSQTLASRAVLEQRVKDMEQKYKDQPVPRPPYWGGYRLRPHMIEFWQERQYRLHDRFLYQRRDDGSWKIERLYP